MDELPQDIRDQIAAMEAQDAASAAPRAGSTSTPSNVRICPHCTFANSHGGSDCEVCMLPLSWRMYYCIQVVAHVWCIICSGRGHSIALVRSCKTWVKCAYACSRSTIARYTRVAFFFQYVTPSHDTWWRSNCDDSNPLGLIYRSRQRIQSM